MVGYSLGTASKFQVIGRGVLSQCKGWSFQNFPWDANVKVSVSMFEADNNWMARSVLRQIRSSLRKTFLRLSY